MAEGLFPEDQRERIESNRRFAEERLAVLRCGAPASAAAAPVSKEVWLEHSLLAYQQRRYEEAEASARQAVHLDPHYAEAHNNVAAAALALGRYQEAVAAAETALRLKPDFPMARNNLAWARQQIHRE
jgi:Flp pilus assembly protein TadD